MFSCCPLLHRMIRKLHHCSRNYLGSNQYDDSTNVRGGGYIQPLELANHRQYCNSMTERILQNFITVQSSQSIGLRNSQKNHD